MTRGEIFDAIRNERNRQETKHPFWHGDEHGLVVLAEEFGEVAKALYELTHSSDIHDRMHLEFDLEDELIQTASVCVRWLENRG